MSAEILLALRAIAAPAAVAAVLGVILLRALPPRLAERLALPIALAAGFCAGYWLLGEWTALVPQKHRQWLPWLAILAGTAGRSTASSYVSWVSWAVLAALGAWVLVPTWETLWPPRLVAIPLLAGYILLLIGLLATLPDRLLGRLFGFLLTAAAVTVGLQIAIGVSAKIGLVALAAAAALGGCAVSACLPRRETKTGESSRDAASRSVIPIFAVLIGGLAFVGTIEPQEPLPIILLAPAAPLALWLFAAGPLAKMEGWKAIAGQSVAVLLLLGIALAVVVAT
jgi:hypothetical protein